jgi:hypothetical protein
MLGFAPSWRRGVEPKEHHAWRAFDLGGWINPCVTLVYPCIVERSMWGCLVGYLYGHMSLFCVNIPHLLYI